MSPFLLLFVLLMSAVVPASAKGVSQIQAMAWTVFALVVLVFVVILISRRRCPRRVSRSSNGEERPATFVSPWSKSVPPKDNGKVGTGPGVAQGAWERDC